MDKIWATGRRKSASARVRLFSGSGKITVNGLDFKEYFNTEALCGYLLQPLKLISGVEKYDVEATIDGGGKAGQAGALRHGI